MYLNSCHLDKQKVSRKINGFLILPCLKVAPVTCQGCSDTPEMEESLCYVSAGSSMCLENEMQRGLGAWGGESWEDFEVLWMVQIRFWGMLRIRSWRMLWIRVRGMLWVIRARARSSSSAPPGLCCTRVEMSVEISLRSS